MASLWDTMFGGAAEADAANKNRNILTNYQTQGTAALDKGYDTSKTALDTAYGSLDALSKKYGGATTLGLDALGVNGADAGSAAWSTFQNANPQTQGAINTGLDAINRRRAGAGMLDSGNADLDALNFAQNTQNQTYDSWIKNLNGFTAPELSATTGAAGVQQSLADLGQTDATNRIGLYGNVASGGMAANNAEAAGAAGGAKNLLNGALSLATLGTSLAGGGGTGSLFKKAA